MDVIKRYFDVASKRYNSNECHGDDCKSLIVSALDKLYQQSDYKYFGDFKGFGGIKYFAFFSLDEISRPVRPDLFIANKKAFISEYSDFIESLSGRPFRWDQVDIERANRVIYTGVMAVACCFDLWQKGSRKTPGTFFEIYMAAVLKIMLPMEYFSKHVPLTDILHDASIDSEEDDSISEAQDDASSVSTDLVIGSRGSDRKNIVIPMKITTRERIVQPFAHQRILDSAFGVGAYTSVVVCISETQQDKRKFKVNHICVPGTVKLFQKYLAPIGGIYYCDIPPRYNMPDVQGVVPVKSVGNLFIDLYSFFESYRNDS